MGKQKRLARRSDELVLIEDPVSSQELTKRDQDYQANTPLKFASDRMDVAFAPVHFSIGHDPAVYSFDLNRCTNPHCRWFGLPQQLFGRHMNIRSRRQAWRYTVDGEWEKKQFHCKPDPNSPSIKPVWPSSTALISNWSVAEELARLVKNDSVVDVDEYIFHRAGCVHDGTTPSARSDVFRKRGQNDSGAQRWQCKTCLKITNVRPRREQVFSYHQKRNDVLPTLFMLVVKGGQVKHTCDVLGIGSETYYQKLEWIYRRCLEFLRWHEQRQFARQTFKRIWLQTDQMEYNLNNIRRWGEAQRAFKAGIYKPNPDWDPPQLQTHVIISADRSSRYVFRADVAYDWDVTPDNIEEDTEVFHDDHLYPFARKNDRIRTFPFAPQPPTPYDHQTTDEYEEEDAKYEWHKQYNGFQINATYTALAHLWLIRHAVQAEKWRFVSDDDNVLKTAILRVFAPEIKEKDAHYFLYMPRPEDPQLTRTQTLMQATPSAKKKSSVKAIRRRKVKTQLDFALVVLRLRAELAKTLPWEEATQGKDKFIRWNPKGWLDHPATTDDDVPSRVTCLTASPSNLDLDHLAHLLAKTNLHAVNGFMNVARRSISILERPLVTARGGGKSYIRANYNPKYAQYALTILRTYVNFCVPIKKYSEKVPGKRRHVIEARTPAQRLGIADRPYTIEDILYPR